MTTLWHTVSLTWYGGQRRQMQIATGTAWWFHNGKPAVPIRWVLVRDPSGKCDTLALLCTDDQREARRHLGVGSQRQWADAAIARTTPVLLGLW